mmetsp:Transcript_8597/g.15600  ORF Transcript_8597/g.15600 Transcript_8597/m.15600 type:complete len:206 (-) Transcript_8597:644-1261(-)
MLLEPTPPIMPPPPPNFAAIRALASSLNRVCLMTYCSSLSPLSRSIPFTSSPGPGMASPNVEADTLVTAAAGEGIIPAPPILLTPPIVLSLPNPPYLLLGVALLCEWNCRCRSARPSLPGSSGWVTLDTKVVAPAERLPQKLPAVDATLEDTSASPRFVPSSCTAAVTELATVESAPNADPNPDMTDVEMADTSKSPAPYPALGL